MRPVTLALLALLLVLPGRAAVHGNFTATEAAPATPSAPSAPAMSAPVPLVGRVPATASKITPTVSRLTSIGTATVFVRAQDLTPQVVAHLREIHQLPRLVSTFYLVDDAATNGRLALDNHHVTLQGLDFTLDPANQLAIHSGVGPDTIVFRDALGAIRHYDLLKEYPAFAALVHFIGGGH